MLTFFLENYHKSRTMLIKNFKYGQRVSLTLSLVHWKLVNLNYLSCLSSPSLFSSLKETTNNYFSTSSSISIRYCIIHSPSSPISTRFFIVLLPFYRTFHNAILSSFSHHPLIILSFIPSPWTFLMDYPSIARIRGRIREFSSRLIEPWDIFFLYSRPT